MKKFIHLLSLRSGKWKKCVRIMKLTTVLLLATFLQLNANVFSQNGRVAINESGISLEELLWKIQSETEFVFVFSENQVSEFKNLSVNLEGDLEDVLELILKDKGLTFEKKDDVFILKKMPQPIIQTTPKSENVIITGKVVDDDNLGIPGANVLLQGSVRGTITDMDGNYSLSIPKGGGTIVVSFIGMETAIVPFTNETVINITLTSAINNLDDIVVTGYQSISRERATGSFSKLNTETIETTRLVDIGKVIEGRIPGLQGGILRGATSMNGMTTPLYVIDGFPVENTRFNSSGGIEENLPDLNIEDIESITVLKDAAATSIYGARAANGVVVIVTKKASKGKASISFSSNFTVSPFNYYTGNFTNSDDIVELEREWASGNPKLQATDGSATDYSSSLLSNGVFTSLGMKALLNSYAGNISESEMNSQLDKLSGMGYKYYNDVEKYAKQNPFYQQYNLNIGSGTDKNSFNASVTYKNNRFEDINTKDQSVGINLRNSTKVSEWLTVDLGTYMMYKKGNTQTYSALSPGFTYQPYNSLVDEDGNPYVSTAESRLSESTLNTIDTYGLYNMDITPLDELDYSIKKSKNFSNRAYAKLKLNFTEWLKYYAMFQYEYATDRMHQLKDEESYTVRSLVNNMASVSSSGATVFNLPYGNIYTTANQFSNSYNFRQQVDIHKIFQEKHDLTIIAGTEIRHAKLEYTDNTLYNYDPDMLTFSPVDQKTLISGGGSILGGYMYASNFAQQRELVNRFVSVYGNAGYTFNDRYTATGSLRWDRSNLWGTDKKYQNKPTWSAGASWNINKENFFNLDWINMLKLRFSYGIGGNIAKDSAPYMTAVYYSNTNVGGTFGYVSSRPNPQLSWEKTATTNIGIDFSVLNQRLNGTIEVYKKKGSDLLANSQGVPTEGWGYSTYTINNGGMTNKGVELSLSGAIIKHKDFGWNAGIVYAYNKNEVTYVNVEAPVYFLQLDYPGSFPRIGTPYSSIYGYKWAGLSETGLPQVYDAEGNKVSTNPTTLEAIENLGSTVPKHSGSFNTSFTYKNFDLSALFIFELGHKLRNTNLPMLSNSYNSALRGYVTNISATNKRIANRWKNPGDELKTDVPRAVFEYDSDFSYGLYSAYSYASVNVINASNIRLSNISLAYHIPTKLCSKLKIQNARLNFNVENVFTMAKSKDAKYMLNGYKSPNYVFGINVNF